MATLLCENGVTITFQVLYRAEDAQSIAGYIRCLPKEHWVIVSSLDVTDFKAAFENAGTNEPPVLVGKRGKRHQVALPSQSAAVDTRTFEDALSSAISTAGGEVTQSDLEQLRLSQTFGGFFR
jgi:hypothetical protein